MKLKPEQIDALWELVNDLYDNKDHLDQIHRYVSGWKQSKDIPYTLKEIDGVTVIVNLLNNSVEIVIR